MIESTDGTLREIHRAAGATDQAVLAVAVWTRVLTYTYNGATGAGTGHIRPRRVHKWHPRHRMELAQ